MVQSDPSACQLQKLATEKRTGRHDIKHHFQVESEWSDTKSLDKYIGNVVWVQLDETREIGVSPTVFYAPNPDHCM
jgi:hypothetical protein